MRRRLGMGIGEFIRGGFCGRGFDVCGKGGFRRMSFFIIWLDGCM